MNISARLAMPRGQRLYISPVAGSSTSQLIESVEAAKNGSSVAEPKSGLSSMSDSLMAFHPAIDEPSNMMPSSSVSSSTIEMSKVTCCHLPRGSVKRKSTYFTSFSLMNFKTSLALFMAVSRPLSFTLASGWFSGQAGFASPAGEVQPAGRRPPGRLKGSEAVRWRRSRSRRSGCGPLAPRKKQKSCHRRSGPSGLRF